MNLHKLTAAVVVAASLTISSAAQVSALPAPTPSTSSSSNGAVALLGLAAIGLFILVVTGSKAPSGGTVTQSGGKTGGSFTLLKF